MEGGRAIFLWRKRTHDFEKFWSGWRPAVGGFPQAQKITRN